MFEFIWPWMFSLLPLPLLVFWLVPKAAPFQSAALRTPFYQDLVKLHASSKPRSFFSHIAFWLAALIWALLITACARPVWAGKPIPIAQQSRNIMLAIDISGSMQIADMAINGQAADRLLVTKQVAHEFIQNRVGDLVGLILFGSRAYLQTPLTTDRKTVQSMLSDATVGLAGTQTAIGDAIGLGIKRLLQQPAKNRVLILLTDGQNNSGTVTPLSVAKLAAKHNIKIYTIGLGADKIVVDGLLGQQAINPSRDLDEKLLRDIATLTGGQFFRAKNTRALKAIYKEIDSLEPSQQANQLYHPRTPLYPWPLTLALLLTFGLGLLKLFRSVIFNKATIGVKS